MNWGVFLNSVTLKHDANLSLKPIYVKPDSGTIFCIGLNYSLNSELNGTHIQILEWKTMFLKSCAEWHYIHWNHLPTPSTNYWMAEVPINIAITVQNLPGNQEKSSVIWTLSKMFCLPGVFVLMKGRYVHLCIFSLFCSKLQKCL
jgi:hypothetical protein